MRDAESSDMMPVCRERTGSLALMSWVTDAVEAIDWALKDAEFEGYPAHSFLVLEVYGCAKGAVGAEEMAGWLRTDPVLGQLFPDKRPQAALLMGFRKRHRAVIQRCLSRVLDVALKARFGDDAEHATPIDYCVVRGLDSWFNPRCGHNPEVEAVERLKVMVYTDNMSVD